MSLVFWLVVALVFLLVLLAASVPSAYAYYVQQSGTAPPSGGTGGGGAERPTPPGPENPTPPVPKRPLPSVTRVGEAESAFYVVNAQGADDIKAFKEAVGEATFLVVVGPDSCPFTQEQVGVIMSDDVPEIKALIVDALSPNFQDMKQEINMDLVKERMDAYKMGGPFNIAYKKGVPTKVLFGRMEAPQLKAWLLTA